VYKKEKKKKKKGKGLTYTLFHPKRIGGGDKSKKGHMADPRDLPARGTTTKKREKWGGRLVNGHTKGMEKKK